MGFEEKTGRSFHVVFASLSLSLSLCFRQRLMLEQQQLVFDLMTKRKPLSSLHVMGVIKLRG